MFCVECGDVEVSRTAWVVVGGECVGARGGGGGGGD